MWALNGKGINDDVVVKVFPDGKLNEQYSILNLFNIYQTSIEMQVIKSRLTLSNCFDFQSSFFFNSYIIRHQTEFQALDLLWVFNTSMPINFQNYCIIKN